MSTQEDIDTLLARLSTYRATLQIYLQQLAIHGVAFAPPSIFHGISECCHNIQIIKDNLRILDAIVEDHPDDKASPLRVPALLSLTKINLPGDTHHVNRLISNTEDFQELEQPNKLSQEEASRTERSAALRLILKQYTNPLSLSSDNSFHAALNKPTEHQNKQIAYPKLLRTIQSVRNSPVSFSPDGNIIACIEKTTFGSELIIRHVYTGQIIQKLGKDSFTSIKFSISGNTLAYGGNYGGIKLYNVDKNHIYKTLNSKGAGRFIFNLEEEILVNCTYSHLEIWRMRDGGLIHRSNRPVIYDIAISPEENMLAIAFTNDILTDQSSYTQVDILDIQNGNVIFSFNFKSPNINGAIISPDWRTLTCKQNNGMLRIYNLKDEKLQETINKSKYSTSQIVYAYSPDGKLVANSNSDHIIQLWDVDNRKPVQYLRGHSEEITKVLFSPDGTLITSISRDRTIRFWDARDGNPLCTIGDFYFVRDLVYSPDQLTFATKEIVDSKSSFGSYIFGFFQRNGYEDDIEQIRVWQIAS